MTPNGPTRNGLALGAAITAWCLYAVAPAEDQAKLPGVRFPFGEEEAKKYQDDYAKAAGLPKEVVNSDGMMLI